MRLRLLILAVVLVAALALAQSKKPGRTSVGVTTMAAVGAVPNANGASISGATLTLQPADATNPGVVSTGTQTLAGAKTFSGNVAMNGSSTAGFFQSSSYLGSGSSSVTTFAGNRSDNATAVGVAFNNASTLSTAGSQLISWQNGGTEFAYTQPNGVSSLWTSHPVTGPGKRLGELTINTTADTAFVATKLPAPSVYGTPSAAPAADGTLMMVDYTTGASNGNPGGVYGPFTSTRFNFRPRFTAVVRTGASIANTRIFVGLANADISGVATLAGLNADRVAVFRYDSGLGDTVWTNVTSDGTTASTSIIGTAVTVAINTTYIFDIDFTRSGAVVFRINNSILDTNSVKTTNLPTGTTDIGIQATATTLTNATKDFYIGKLALEQN